MILYNVPPLFSVERSLFSEAQNEDIQCYLATVAVDSWMRPPEQPTELSKTVLSLLHFSDNLMKMGLLLRFFFFLYVRMA